jgi:hypothetical protein
LLKKSTEVCSRGVCPVCHLQQHYGSRRVAASTVVSDRLLENRNRIAVQQRCGRAGEALQLSAQTVACRNVINCLRTGAASKPNESVEAYSERVVKCSAGEEAAHAAVALVWYVHDKIAHMFSAHLRQE